MAILTLTHRLVGAAVLDVGTYEEIEADRAATPQALVIVPASSLATGIGAIGLGGRPAGQLLLMSVAALLGWAAWALLIVQIGGRLLPEPGTRVDVTELLRTIGFASAPGLLRVFGVLPALTIPVFAITSLWMLVAMVVAVRQALDHQHGTGAGGLRPGLVAGRLHRDRARAVAHGSAVVKAPQPKKNLYASYGSTCTIVSYGLYSLHVTACADFPAKTNNNRRRGSFDGDPTWKRTCAYGVH